MFYGGGLNWFIKLFRAMANLLPKLRLNTSIHFPVSTLCNTTVLCNLNIHHFLNFLWHKEKVVPKYAWNMSRIGCISSFWESPLAWSWTLTNSYFSSRSMLPTAESIRGWPSRAMRTAWKLMKVDCSSVGLSKRA